MNGAGVTGRVKATAGVVTIWGWALCVEPAKVVMLLAIWWSAVMACGVTVATMVSILCDVVDERVLGFKEIVPIWALAVQIGLVMAGATSADAEHSTA